MGDRVLIVVTDGTEISPAIYGHWIGHDAPSLIKSAGEAGIIRKGDPSYAAARILGFIHESDPRSTTGLGLLAAPDDLKPETLCEYSHGDAGVIVVNVETGDVTQTQSSGTKSLGSVKLAA